MNSLMAWSHRVISLPAVNMVEPTWNRASFTYISLFNVNLEPAIHNVSRRLELNYKLVALYVITRFANQHYCIRLS